MSDNPTTTTVFVEGDTYSYLSTSSLTVVTWTRDGQGVWRCDDGREMTGNDEEMAQQMAQEPVEVWIAEPHDYGDSEGRS